MAEFNFQSEYNLQNVNITGDSPHFGDKFYFESYQDFSKANPGLNNIEEEIAKKIFHIVDDENERKSLLNFLQKLKQEDKKEIQEKDPNIWKKFLLKLKDSGLDKLADKATLYTIDKIPELESVFSNLG